MPVCVFLNVMKEVSVCSTNTGLKLAGWFLSTANYHAII